MIYPNVKFGSVSADEVAINLCELAARIGAGLDYSNEKIELCTKEFNKAANYRYAYTEVTVAVTGNVCDFGFARVESRALARVLCGCERAFFLAVSAGIGVDRLIARLEAISKADAFFTDSIASAAIESFCDLICEKICEGVDCTKRFSPGYADLPLEFQPHLLERIASAQSVGITLNSSLLMSPMKSITAIIGIKG